MFACFLCKEARPLENDGLELWQSLDRKELETELVKGVALVEHKFCKRCFENRKEMKLAESIQEVDYSKLIIMMERMFPKMGKLDAESVEKEERRKAEEEQRQFQEKLKKQREEEAKMKLLEEQATKLMLEEQIGSTMEDLELVDWDEEMKDLQTATQADTSLPIFINGEDKLEQISVANNNVSRDSTTKKIEPPTTPSPRSQTEAHVSKSDIQYSSPILAAHDYDSDDVFGEDFRLEDIELGQVVNTPFTSDDTTMDDVRATKNTEPEDDFGWCSDIEGIETNAEVSSTTDAMATPTPRTTSDFDRMMCDGGF